LELYDEALFQNESSSGLYGGIVFDEDFDFLADGKVPKLNYKIRFSESHTSTDTKYIFPPILFKIRGET
jgi:hypothetical protein